MKISKLFHWLYALIMFLPVFFWIPTALYYGFNEHATDPNNTDVQINYKYQSNEVNSVDDLVSNNIYHFNFYSDELLNDEMLELQFYIISGDITASGYQDNLDPMLDPSNTYVFNSKQIYLLSTKTDGGYIEYLFPNGDYIDIYFGYFSSHDLIIQFISYNDITLNNFNDYFSIANYNEIESVDIIETEGISNAMYHSWQDVWSLPMFSWSSDTFFSAPFNYIANLFGIQAGNTLSYCLSYWFSISIIWLVFDLMIYVPLLVHRWLDKAAIE